jgi:hypothetical protein
MTTEDRRNINLTADSERAARTIKEKFGFPELQDVVRLGIAYAVVLRLEPSPFPPGTPRGSNYSSAAIDGDDRLLSSLFGLLSIGDGDLAPYQAMEILMSRGILRLEKDIREGHVVDLSDLFDVGDSMAEIDPPPR